MTFNISNYKLDKENTLKCLLVNLTQPKYLNLPVLTIDPSLFYWLPNPPIPLIFPPSINNNGQLGHNYFEGNDQLPQMLAPRPYQSSQVPVVPEKQ